MSQGEDTYAARSARKVASQSREGLELGTSSLALLTSSTLFHLGGRVNVNPAAFRVAERMKENIECLALTGHILRGIRY